MQIWRSNDLLAAAGKMGSDVVFYVELSGANWHDLVWGCCCQTVALLAMRFLSET